jgi:hypothetical protein
MTNPKAIHSMLQAQGLQDCNSATTPHIDGHDMSDMQADEDMINLKTYQSILGSCRLLADTTHPEIAFITGIAGQHAHRPTARHMQAIKRILRYLAGATNSGLYYPSRQTPTFAAFSDIDWASCSQTRKSQTGVLFTVNDVPVHWISIKQPTISLSSTEAEYIAGGHVGRDLTWFTALLRAWYVPSLSPISLRIDDKPSRDATGSILPQTIALGIDSKGAIDMARCEGPTKRTNHIDVKHHYLQQQVASHAFRLQQISTADQKWLPSSPSH